MIRGDELIGILSNRDYRKILERVDPDERIHGIAAVTVAEIIARLVIEKKIGCVPIVEGGRAIGIVTQKDVLAALLN